MSDSAIDIEKRSTKSEIQSDTHEPVDVVFEKAVPDATPAPPAVTFPEGGYQAWATVVGAFLVQFVTFGYVNSFGVYQDYYVRQYLTDYTPRDLGWIGGMQVLLTFGCGIFTGRAFDRGYFYHLIIIASIIHVFSYFMLSISHENKYYQVLLSQGIGGGLASGLSYTPTVAIPAHYFAHKRPLATGIVTAGSALGAVIHPIMLNKLFQGSVGFHNGVRISTGMNAGLLLLALALMRTRLPPKKVGSRLPVLEFLSQPVYLFAVFGGIFFLMGLFVPPFYIQLDAISHNVDENLSFYLLSILNAASFFGRIVTPVFTPKVGPFNIIVPSTLVMAVTLVCFGAAKDFGGFACIAIFFGFSSGAGVAITAPVLVTMARSVDEFGARIGIQLALSGVAGFIAWPILGALLSSKLHWWRPIIFGGVMMFACSLSYAISRFLQVRHKGTQWV